MALSQFFPILSQAPRESIFDLVLYAGPVAKVVLFFLLVLSIVSWAIIFLKYRYFRRARVESKKFKDAFWSLKKLDQINEVSQGLSSSHLAGIFKAGYEELRKVKEENPGHGKEIERALEVIGRALSTARHTEGERQESLLTFLATTGNSSPFIGLFGTVWGIMDSFRNIGLTGAASLAVVAPGISEALIATAAGLFAAIPAVMAYNYFVSRARAAAGEMEAFSSEFLNVVEKHFL